MPPLRQNQGIYPPLPPFPPELKRENTRAHIVFSIATLGAWAPIWAIMRWRIAASNKRAKNNYRFELMDYHIKLARYNDRQRQGY